VPEKRVVQLEHQHIDVSRGDLDLKEYQYGNTTVVIHSPLVNMNIEEKKNWFKEEWEKGNKVLKGIAEAVGDCYRSA
jgi:hypothetical protein